ncbi:nucleotidyltransferase family protein [Roseomonas sp. CCTCC AB2023176]|uniref:nucleotidyltransferase family protein n=1 Tax=Roseomonas sp. CCTCC AB2023176 TaxID=3342640 RepID=UPI0035DE576E
MAGKLARLRAAVGELRLLPAAEAPRLGGRYLLFGSAARGEMRHDSDVDILLDFPDGGTDQGPGPSRKRPARSWARRPTSGPSPGPPSASVPTSCRRQPAAMTPSLGPPDPPRQASTPAFAAV